MEKPTIIAYQEFKILSTEEKIRVFTQYNDHYSVKELRQAWGVPSSYIYNHRAKLLKPSEKTNTGNKKKTNTTSTSSKTKKKRTGTNSLKGSTESNSSLEKELRLEIERLNKVIIQSNNKTETEVKQIKKENHQYQQHLIEQEQRFQNILVEMKESEPKESLGFQVSFKGEYSATELEKKIQKILLFIEGNSRFYVDFSITEQTDNTILEIEPLTLPSPSSFEETEKQLLIDEIESLKKSVTGLKEQMNNTIEGKIFEGYNALKNEVEGLHTPQSEFQTAQLNKQINEEELLNPESEDGYKISISTSQNTKSDKMAPKYQAYYVCELCGAKEKKFILKDTMYILCRKCNKKLKVRFATEKGFSHTDQFGNYYVAGKFRSEH